MRYFAKILIVFIIGVTLAGCGQSEQVELSYEDISVDEAKNMILSENVKVIDVRTPQEYEEGHIPNSTLLPLQEIENRYEELNPDDQLLIVCRSGNRSTQASEFLVTKGYSKIYNMVGGMNSWDGEIEK